jgi:hypothetical protein
LEIYINEESARGVGLDLVDLFRDLKKRKHDGKKVIVTILPLP